MSYGPNTKWRKWLILLAVIALTALLLAPLPLEITSIDKARAASNALENLFQNRRVLTDKGYSHLFETEYVKDRNRVYFENRLGIPDTVFLNHGLKPILKGWKPDFEKGDAVVSFSYQDMLGKPVTNIQFAYVFGNLGGHVYEIRIHKSLLMRYFVYIHQWMV